MSQLQVLFDFHDKHKEEMRDFLDRCRRRGESEDALELFKWLCKNLLASRAEWTDTQRAAQSKCLFAESPEDVCTGLRESGYKSQNNRRKAEWVFEARRLLWDGECGMDIVDFVDVLGLKCVKDSRSERDRLADATLDNHIPGLGMKEASHFLRGLGFSHNNLAILDSRLLEQLPKLGVVAASSPKNPSRRQYLDIESKLIAWTSSNQIGIPLDGLDWLLWYMAKGIAPEY